MGSQTHQVRSRFPGRDGVPNLELPFPQAGFGLDEAEFNALAVHMQILRFAPAIKNRPTQRLRLFKFDQLLLVRTLLP